MTTVMMTPRWEPCRADATTVRRRCRSCGCSAATKSFSRRDRIRETAFVERRTHRAVLLCFVHEGRDRGERFRLALPHRNRDAHLLKLPIGDARARHLAHVCRE